MSVRVEMLEGNARRIVATFRAPDEDSDPDDVSTWPQVDPTTVTISRMRLGDPAAELETWDYPDGGVTKEATGVYARTLTFPDDGNYMVGARGTGDCEAYDEVPITVHNAKALPEP